MEAGICAFGVHFKSKLPIVPVSSVPSSLGSCLVTASLFRKQSTLLD